MKYIKIKTFFRGFHQYNNAPEEVSFLRNKHRHVFQIEITLEVDHNDRDVEFFLLQTEVDKFIQETFVGKDLFESCEAIAESIGDYLISQEYKVLQVEVSEDGENAGGITYGR